MQRVVTIGSLGKATSSSSTTSTTSTAATALTDSSVAVLDPGGAAWSLFLESLPTLLVWTAGALALGYAAVQIFSPKRARRRDPQRRRSHRR
jgi:hypothetical protein